MMMTKEEEEASKTLTQYIDYDAETPDYYEMEKACKVAIKALEQEPKTLNDVLDELIARMEKSRVPQSVPYEDDYYSFLHGMDKCIETIREYKAINGYE